MKTSTNTVPQMARNADTGAADRLLHQVVAKAALRDGRLRNWHPGDEEDQPPFVDLVGPPGWESQGTSPSTALYTVDRGPLQNCQPLKVPKPAMLKGSVSGTPKN